MTTSAIVSELQAWARGLSTEQLEQKRADIPFEVRRYGELELIAIDAELLVRQVRSA